MFVVLRGHHPRYIPRLSSLRHTLHLAPSVCTVCPIRMYGQVNLVGKVINDASSWTHPAFCRCSSYKNDTAFTASHIRRYCSSQEANDTAQSTRSSSTTTTTTTTTTHTNMQARSGLSGKSYPRDTAALLCGHACAEGYTSPYWVTRKQLDKLGVRLKEGEGDRGFELVIRKDDTTASSFPSMFVYNADQTDDPQKIQEKAESADATTYPSRGTRDGKTYHSNKSQQSSHGSQRGDYSRSTGTSIWDL